MQAIIDDELLRYDISTDEPVLLSRLGTEPAMARR